jgi:hypothetical protein
VVLTKEFHRILKLAGGFAFFHPFSAALSVSPFVVLLCVGPTFRSGSAARPVATSSAVRVQSRRWQGIACSIRFMARMRWVGRVRLSSQTNSPPTYGMCSVATTSKTLRQAAVSGFGIALLPSWIIGQDIAAGSLRRLLTTADDAGGDAGGVYVLRALAEPPTGCPPSLLRCEPELGRSRSGTGSTTKSSSLGRMKRSDSETQRDASRPTVE